MRKIDKNYDAIFSTKYKEWVNNLESSNTKHPNSRTYYDDVVMDLYRCQQGVCAYTEMHICVPNLYVEDNWSNGKYKIIVDEVVRSDHFGELEHFNPDLKNHKYWLWDNFFMIHAKINSLKSNKLVFPYLKPDLNDYLPGKYFDYDESTHRFIPNTEITDMTIQKEIQYMIDEVLFLNHGVVLNDRKDYINSVKFKIENDLNYVVDRFYTSVAWCI